MYNNNKTKKCIRVGWEELWKRPLALGVHQIARLRSTVSRGDGRAASGKGRGGWVLGGLFGGGVFVLSDSVSDSSHNHFPPFHIACTHAHSQVTLMVLSINHTMHEQARWLLIIYPTPRGVTGFIFFYFF